MNHILLVAVLFLPSIISAQAPDIEIFEEPDALRRHQPIIVLIHQETGYRFGSPRIDNFSSEEGLKIGFSRKRKGSPLIRSYKIYGLAVERNYRYISTERIFYDSTFYVEFQNKHISPLNVAGIGADGLGGSYNIIFDSVVVVDRNGSKHLLLNPRQVHSITCPFNIIPERDPFVIKNGLPTFEILVNGIPQTPGVRVQRSDELTFILTYPENVDLEGSTFFVSSYQVTEHACFGPETKFTIEEETAFPFSLQNEDIDIGFGGDFYVELGEMYRISSEGKMYNILLPLPKRFTKYQRDR